MKKKIGMLSAVVLAAGALVLGPSVAAMADASASYSNGGYQRATAYWNAGADRLSASDVRNDGWGARTKWETKAGGIGTFDNTDGAGTTKNKTITGVGQIRIRACSINNGNDIGCSGFSAYSAG